jgi:hypothetical protein
MNALTSFIIGGIMLLGFIVLEVIQTNVYIVKTSSRAILIASKWIALAFSILAWSTFFVWRS